MSFYDQRRLQLAERNFSKALGAYEATWGLINIICNEILQAYNFYEEREFGEPRKRILHVDFLYKLDDNQYEDFYKKLHEYLTEYELASHNGWEFLPCEEEIQKLKKSIKNLSNINPEHSSLKKLECFCFYDINLNLKTTA